MKRDIWERRRRNPKNGERKSIHGCLLKSDESFLQKGRGEKGKRGLEEREREWEGNSDRVSG